MSEDTARVTREIVIPLAVVLGLLANAVIVGVAWGRLGQRLDTQDARQAEHDRRLDKGDEAYQVIRERLWGLERDAKEDRKEFDILEDYTRGRIDRLPYHPPPSRR